MQREMPAKCSLDFNNNNNMCICIKESESNLIIFTRSVWRWEDL